MKGKTAVGLDVEWYAFRGICLAVVKNRSEEFSWSGLMYGKAIVELMGGIEAGQLHQKMTF